MTLRISYEIFRSGTRYTFLVTVLSRNAKKKVRNAITKESDSNTEGAAQAESSKELLRTIK